MFSITIDIQLFPFIKDIILFSLSLLRLVLWSVLENIPWLLRRMCILCLGGMFCKYPFVLTL